MHRTDVMTRRLSGMLTGRLAENPVWADRLTERLANLLSELDGTSASRSRARVYMPEDDDLRSVFLMIQRIHSMSGNWAPSDYAAKRERFLEQVALARTDYNGRQHGGATLRRRVGWATAGLVGAAVLAASASPSASAHDLHVIEDLPRDVVTWLEDLVSPATQDESESQAVPNNSTETGDLDAGDNSAGGAIPGPVNEVPGGYDGPVEDPLPELSKPENHGQLGGLSDADLLPAESQTSDDESPVAPAASAENPGKVPAHANENAKYLPLNASPKAAEGGTNGLGVQMRTENANASGHPD